jgi:hypothetical protein
VNKHAIALLLALAVAGCANVGVPLEPVCFRQCESLAAPGTVQTYPDRAFDRLGIHHRNELFALVQLPEVPEAPPR